MTMELIGIEIGLFLNLLGTAFIFLKFRVDLEKRLTTIEVKQDYILTLIAANDKHKPD